MRAVAVVALVVAVGLAGCLEDPQSDVAVASYPVHYIVERLTNGTNLTVAVMGNPHVSLHTFEPSAHDIRVMRGTKLVMLHGLGLEHWAYRALDVVGAEFLELPGIPAPPHHCHGPCPPAPPTAEEPIPDGVAAIFIASLPGNDKYLEPDHIHEADGSITSGAGLVDAHTWMDPRAYAAEALRASKALAQRFPEHAERIDANFANFSADLHDLHTRFASGLAACEKDLIATNHNAYAYLARRYDFSVVSLHAIEPGAQPDPESVRQVVQVIRDLDLRHFFIEEGTDPNVVRAIQEETGVAIRTLHAIELRPDGDHTYLSRQLENLAELQQALECT